MPGVPELLEAIQQRAEEEADAVIPVLALLAQPDEEVRSGQDVIHAAARRLNRARLDAAEQRFRAGALSTTEVRERLSVSRQAVAERVRTGGLIAAKVGSRLAYPDWQFGATGVVPGLPDVLAALRDSVAGDGAARPGGTRAAGALGAAQVRAADAIMRAPQPGVPDRMSLAELLAVGDTAEVVHRLTVRSDQS